MLLPEFPGLSYPQAVQPKHIVDWMRVAGNFANNTELLLNKFELRIFALLPAFV
jgi:hypothetical protein